MRPSRAHLPVHPRIEARAAEGAPRRVALPALFAAAAIAALAGGCVAPPDDEPFEETETFGTKGAAVVESVYTVDGWMSLEDQYVPRVCTAENGGADFEALKAQAVAARTYLLRAMRDDPSLGTSKPILNGTSFQAYSASASQGCVDATNATRGVTGRWGGELIIANYVAGALVNEDGSLGADLYGTEHWVTYNEGLTGSDVKPTALSWTSRPDNRGCMGQNRSDWLSRRGYDYASILRYFYGADLELGEAASSTPSQGGCGDVTYHGDCDGSTLVWCEKGGLRTASCSAIGRTCAWQDDAVGYNCVVPPQEGACAGVDYHGYCDGPTLVWCEAGALQTFDCSTAGMTCGYQDGAVGNNCL
jgi:predicted small metal-binding protein